MDLFEMLREYKDTGGRVDEVLYQTICQFITASREKWTNAENRAFQKTQRIEELELEIKQLKNSNTADKDKILDVFIAVKDYGWQWKEVTESLKVLVPPETDERRFWTTKWDESGLPHWMPKFSKGES